MRKINQKALAKELQITDRRVRQLVGEFILPEPDEDGLYDLDICGERFDLFKEGSEREWHTFEEETLKLAGDAERAVADLNKDGAGDAEIGAAGYAIGECFRRLRFMYSAKCKSDPAYPLIMRLADADEGRLLGPVIAKIEALHGPIRWDA